MIFFMFLFFSCAGRLPAQDLFLLAGQSNAVGQGDSLKSPVCFPGTAFEYDALADDFIPLKDPIGKPWKLFQRAGTGSVAPAFAERWNVLTNRKVYVVTAARGGASCSEKARMDDYDTWDRSGNLFSFAVSKTRMAENKSGLSLKGILWIQGERDANAILSGAMSKKDYELALKQLIKRFRVEWGANLPFYIVQTAYQQDKEPAGCEAVRKVQHKIARKVKGVHLAYKETGKFAERNWFKDKVHYNQEALNHIGRKMAEYMGKH
jgi:hypothetical protein